MQLKTLYLIVPIFNERENIPRLLSSCALIQAEFKNTFRLKCLFIDDGSQDGSAEYIRSKAPEFAEKFAIEVISHPTNLGPGKAFGTGFAALAEKLEETDWVVTMEGDNTSRFELLKQMYVRAQEGFEVVLASPYMYGGGVSNTNWFRLFLSFVANFFLKETLGLRGLMTVSSFYRLYRGTAILKLQKIFGAEIISLMGFESMVELLMKFVFVKTAISEVPMQLDATLRVGKSKMKVVKTSVGYLKLWFKKPVWLEKIQHSEQTVVFQPALPARRTSSSGLR